VFTSTGGVLLVSPASAIVPPARVTAVAAASTGSEPEHSKTTATLPPSW
jgi:hypothetical protein